MASVKTWTRRLSFRGLSIQKRLSLLICVMLLSVLIIGGMVSYFQVRNAALKSGGDRLLSAVNQLTGLLTQSTQNQINSTRAIGANPVFTKFLQTPDTATIRSLNEILIPAQDTSTILVEIFDPKMNRLHFTGKPGVEDRIGYAKLERQQLLPDTGLIGNFYNVDQQLYFPIVTGILENKYLRALVVRWRKVSNSSRSVEQVVKLMGLEDARIYFGNSDNSIWTNLSNQVENPVSADATEKAEILSYTNVQGEEMIAVRKPVRSTSWSIVIEESKKVILKPARKFLSQLVIIGSILLVIGIAWAWMMSRNIARPINRLTAATTVIASGDYSQSVAIERRDEVGKLARAFNAMVDQLSKARAGLESKVMEAEDANEQLRNLSAHLQNIREEERIHIAREMHDELGQLLTGFKMDISWLNKRLSEKEDANIKERLKGMASLVDEAVKFVREISAELRPSILDDLGLVPALEWHSQQFEKRYNIKIHFHSNVQEIKLPPIIATGLFRMYQESLTNVARHADASKVIANLTVIDEDLQLTINDDGKGFDHDEIASKNTLGLLGMKERASMIGGVMQINSDPGSGTTIVIAVNLRSQPKGIVSE